MQQILEKFNFLPNDDPYRQKTQPKCSSASVHVCMPILAAASLAVSGEIGNRQKRTELFYIYRLPPPTISDTRFFQRRRSTCPACESVEKLSLLNIAIRKWRGWPQYRRLTAARRDFQAGFNINKVEPSWPEGPWRLVEFKSEAASAFQFMCKHTDLKH